VRRVLRKLLVVLLAGVGLVLAGPQAAYAYGPVEIPANTPGGISATFTFGGAVVPHPYTPQIPASVYGPNKCLLMYHQYYPTPGCGGFTFDVALHHVREQPGFADAPLGGRFAAYADTERTFGCVDSAGAFLWDTSFVVRTEETTLDGVYYLAGADYLLGWFRGTESGDFGPPFFLNFEPVEFSCATGTTPTQYGLKVTDLRLSAIDSPFFGTQSWTAAGPFYA
jgi:hypothetical protein